MSSFPCSLKGNQKVFYLNRNLAASCCRANGQLIGDKSIPDLITIWNNQSQDLINGIKINDCSHCWKEEHSGKISYRQANEGKANEEIEICIDNLCNHMCSYCSPKFSSTWEKNIKEFGTFELIPASDRDNQKVSAPEVSADIDDFWDQLIGYVGTRESNSVSLRILGGEPLMQMASLRRVFDLDVGKIKTITVTSNLSPPSPKFLHYAVGQEQFRGKLRFLISLDSTPEYNHVPRWGFDKESFYRNLESLSQNNIYYSLNSVVSALSVFDLPEFCRWTAEQSISVKLVNLYHPNSLAVALLPKHIRQSIIDDLPIEMIPKHILQHLQAPEPNWLEKKNLRSYIGQYFQRTGTDPAAINNNRFQKYWALDQ